MKAVKKWLKWSLIGVGGLVLAFAIVWGVLMLNHYNIFAAKGWQGNQYLDNMGKPLMGWQVIDGKTFYFNPGKVTGWLETEKGKYYLDNQGNPQTGWFTDENSTYLLSPEGKVITGWVQTERGNRYFSEDGVMATGALDAQGKQLYFLEDGTPWEGWFEDRYYVGGVALTGWQELEGERYYFFSDGIAADGWQTLNEHRYLFTQGKTYTGWYEEGSARYYFRENGQMAVGAVEIDGVTRFFTSAGKYVVMVNFQYPVPEDYVLDLVNVEGHRFDAGAAEDLRRMLAAARAEGHAIYINNTYRSIEVQRFMFNRSLYSYTSSGMDEQSAIELITESLMLPGHSEHHLALAVDFRCGNHTYKWLAENSWKYGFVLRYPEGKTDITGIMYEPWHFRHVGMELAQELYESGLCMEEYIQSISLSTEDGQAPEF